MKVKHRIILMLIPLIGYYFILSEVTGDDDWEYTKKGGKALLCLGVYQSLCFAGLYLITKASS